MTHFLSNLGVLRKVLARATPGAAPGTISILPDAPLETRIRVVAFDAGAIEEREVEEPATLAPLLAEAKVVWIDVDGLGDARKLEALASAVGLHPLAFEDAVKGNQRPKVELYPEHLFLVTRMVSLEDVARTEQLSLFLGKNYVVTLQGELPGDCLEPVRARLRSSCNHIRELGPDYLAYSILDAVVDAYFPVLEEFVERLEKLEENVISTVDKSDAARIQAAKHDLFTIRRALWPMRDAVSGLFRDSNPYVTPETKIYVRDVHDHTAQLIDIVDSYHEVTSGLMDIHLASMSNRMNEIMKVLTTMSMVFIPLNFIAGVYGMNFDPARSPWNMPELEWTYGYPWALGLMAVTASSLVLYFRKKSWL
jgi:magnesium transporter